MVRKRSKSDLKRSWVLSKKDPEFESVNKRISGAVDENQVRDYTQVEAEEYETNFRKKLETAGLNLLVMDILVLKFVYDLNFTQIAEELKIIDTSTAIRLYSEAREYLKTVGFK
jgi:hypothetical protein